SVREVSSYFHLLPFLPGRMESARLGHGESLYAIRTYQEGESARIVDWKASAKTGQLMARDYAREEESRFCLILDTLVHSAAPGAGRDPRAPGPAKGPFRQGLQDHHHVQATGELPVGDLALLARRLFRRAVDAQRWVL